MTDKVTPFAEYVRRDEMQEAMAQEKNDRRTMIRRESDRIDRLRRDHDELDEVVRGKRGDNGLASQVAQHNGDLSAIKKGLWMLVGSLFTIGTALVIKLVVTP